MDKSISELVAADPATTSHFIDNELKAILEFITSDDMPIGKITTIIDGNIEAMGYSISIYSCGWKMLQS